MTPDLDPLDAFITRDLPADLRRWVGEEAYRTRDPLTGLRLFTSLDADEPHTWGSWVERSTREPELGLTVLVARHQPDRPSRTFDAELLSVVRDGEDGFLVTARYFSDGDPNGSPQHADRHDFPWTDRAGGYGQPFTMRVVTNDAYDVYVY